MRLGMGFNSYTQTNCISDAVKPKGLSQMSTEKHLQDATYTSKFVQGLSEIASAKHISHSAAIKDGTVEVLSNANFIDEDKIKAADLNLLVSVQVTTQIATLDDSAKFQHMEGIRVHPSEFNETYGDSYISGFMTGGEFSSIVSIRCLDREHKDSTIRAIKQAINKNIGGADLAGLSVLKDTEMTVSVNWTAGDQYEGPNQPWTLGSVYEAAAAFPSSIMGKPLQRTWAILTKYTANRSFQQWASLQSLRPLDYDILKTYTAGLFDNFMEYKHLFKKVQHIISHGEQYTQVSKHSSIPVNNSTLIAVRIALRNEMDKIVTVVNLLSKRPELLSQVDVFNVTTDDTLVCEIVAQALATSVSTKLVIEPSIPVQSTLHSEPTADPSSDESVLDFNEIQTPRTNTSETSQPMHGFLPVLKRHESAEVINIDLGSLIAPEVWSDLLPVHKDAAVSPDNRDGKLRILAAVYGLHDVTRFLQKHVTADQRLELGIEKIGKLVRCQIYETLAPALIMSLSVLYEYGDGVMRIHTADYNSKSPGLITITQVSNHPVVKTESRMTAGKRFIAVIYGGRSYNSDSVRSKIEADIGFNVDAFATIDTPRVRFSNGLMGEDPHPGFQKTGVIFFETLNGDVRVGVGLEGQYCTLTECPQLAELTLETIKEIEVIKKVPTKAGNKAMKKAAIEAARTAMRSPVSLSEGTVAQCKSTQFKFVYLY
ncbi:hypothetical protein ACHAPU_007122 [Fusarium lateritium]